MRYLLPGLLACGTCGRQMESAWSNGRPAYRCRHGHTSAAQPDPARARNAYVREDRIMAQLPALHLLLTGPAGVTRRRRTRRGTDVRCPAAEDVICFLRQQQITLTYDPAAGTLHAAAGGTRPDHHPDSKLTRPGRARHLKEETSRNAARPALA
jgi:site-specific DNA recombinase